MSLRRRLALIFGAVVAGLVVVAGALNWWFAGASLLGSVDDQLAEQANSLEVVIDRGPGSFPDLRPSGRPGRFDEAAFRVEFIGDDEAPRTDASIPTDAKVLAAARAGSGDQYRTEDIDGRPFRVLTRHVDNLTIELATDIEPIESGLDRLRRGLLVGGLAGVGIAGVLGWVVAQRFTRPIVKVTEAAGQLAEQGELPERIETERNDEVGQLADSFNELVAALQLSREQQRRLVADASHELRTPLTSLRMKIEFLQAEPHLAVEQRQSVVDGAAAELDSLGLLVAELVDLARNSSIKEEPVPLDLGEVVEEAAARTRLTKHRPVTTSTVGTVVVARPMMVRRALSNLIDNAYKFSPADTPLEIHEFGGGIEVRDHGPGIALEYRERAFDRFFRAPTAHTTSGSGIGLAIVKQAADSHGGRVWIDDAIGGGAVVGFSVGVEAPPDDS